MDVKKYDFVCNLPTEIIGKAFQSHYQHMTTLVQTCIDIIHEFAFKEQLEEKIGPKKVKEST